MNRYRQTLFALLVICPPLGADTVTDNKIQTEHSTQQQLQQQASQWGLSSNEYQRYLELMAGERGTWSPGLDPITALGVSTDDAAERRRLAELFVRTEFERTRKELAFQVAVNDAWKRLYPDTPRVHSVDGRKTQAKAAITRYAFITRIGCESCDRRLDSELSRLMAAPQGLDIYVAGSKGDDAVLRDWADQRPAIVKALRAQRITLNHGTPFNEVLALPVIYHKEGSGQWHEQH